MTNPFVHPAARLLVAALALALLAPASLTAQADPPVEPEEPPAVANEELPLEGFLVPPPGPPVELLPVTLEGSLTTGIGTGRLLTLLEDVERVALADESVARIQVISSREILLTGLRAGRTTLFIWLRDGRRARYVVIVQRELGLLRRALDDLAPGISIEVDTEGTSLILLGEVEDAETAGAAEALANRLVAAQGGPPVEVLSFLRFSEVTTTADLWLTEALHSIDPRIALRRIQVGPTANPQADSYILEGRVRTVRGLERAVILAERQLGGAGVTVRAPGGDLTLQRSQSFAGTGPGGLGSLQRPASGLASQVARGLTVTSESGRVLSLLEVDELPQIMVSIRVYEIDRAKVRRVGLDFRLDSEHVSVGSSTGIQASPLPRLLDGVADVTGITGGNLAGSFVGGSIALAAAIELLEDRDLARAVAEPNVLTLSGEEATVLIGGEVPIPVTTVGQVTAVQGFLFQSFGVQLDIRPTLDDDGVVALEVSPSIIRPSATLGINQVPGFTVQSVQTTARVPAGQSLVLGGLLSFDESFQEARVPFLGRIPIFRRRRQAQQQQELLFVITPRLVEVPQPALGAVDLPTGDDIDLPELSWPKGTEVWEDDMEPQWLPADGVPIHLRRPGSEPPQVPAPFDPPVPGAHEESSAPPLDASVENAPSAADARVVLAVARAATPCLNLRPEPTLASPRVDCLPPGTRVELLDQVEGWDLVLLPGGRSGWMATDLLDLVAD